MVLYSSLDELSRGGTVSVRKKLLTFQSYEKSSPVIILEALPCLPHNVGGDNETHAWRCALFTKAMEMNHFLVPLVFSHDECYIETPMHRLTDVLSGAKQDQPNFMQRVMADVADALLALHNMYSCVHGHLDTDAIVFHRGRWTLQLDAQCHPIRTDTFAPTAESAVPPVAVVSPTRKNDFFQYVTLLTDVLLPRLLPSKCERFRLDSSTHVRRSDVTTTRICSLRDAYNAKIIGGPLMGHVSIAHFYLWFISTLHGLTRQATSLVHDDPSTRDDTNRIVAYKTEWLDQAITRL